MAMLKPRFGLQQMKVIEAAVMNTAGTVAIGAFETAEVRPGGLVIVR